MLYYFTPSIEFYETAKIIQQLWEEYIIGAPFDGLHFTTVRFTQHISKQWGIDIIRMPVYQQMDDGTYWVSTFKPICYRDPEAMLLLRLTYA